MTYKEKMVKEHPTVDSNFIMFSCPGSYFDDAPHCYRGNCPESSPSVKKCAECWNTEIPAEIPEVNSEAVEAPTEIPVQEYTEKTPIDVKKIAARVKELYNAFRDEGLNHQEAFEITKIIISAEVNHALRYDDKEINNNG